MNLGQILELDALACEQVKKFDKKRFLFSSLVNDTGRHFVGIVGPRGVGKTVLLRQLRLTYRDKALYVSMDSFDGDLFEFATRCKRDLGINILFLDEIHFYESFSEALKQIYDFLNIRIFFSSSVSLSIFGTSVDLCRRVILKTLYPFSFREYLFFVNDVQIDPIKFEDLVEGRFDRSVLRFGKRFHDFLKGGIFPFSLDEPFGLLDILQSVVKKIIQSDIPTIADLKIDELEKIESVLTFIGRSGVDDISYSSISSNCGITKYKAKQYVDLLEQAFVLQRVFPAGSNVMREPKILMCLPYRLLYRDFADAIGALREDFFVEMMRAHNRRFFYLKSKRGRKMPDYLVPIDGKKVAVEIGGKHKRPTQFKGIKVDTKIILTDSDRIDGIHRPLFLAGRE